MLSNISALGGSVHLVRHYAIDYDYTWSAFNPSVQVDEAGRYWMVFRSSNYFFSKHRTVELTTETKVRNRLFIGLLDTDTMKLEPSSIKEIAMEDISPDIRRGIEDARLYFDGKTWCLSATHLEKTCPRARIAVLRIESPSNPAVLGFTVLEGPEKERVEKNWMPIHDPQPSFRQDVQFMYSCEVAVSNLTFNYITQDLKLTNLRGGTPLVPFDETSSLAVVHEVYYIEKQGFNPNTFTSSQKLRCYSHRFVRFNQNYEVTQISDPFIFHKEGIEFAAGLAAYKDGFIISFGREDIASYVATISTENILKTLKDL